MAQVIVCMKHVRAAQLCAHGTRAWLQAHDFDLGDFLRHGMPVEAVEATGDAFALRVAALARADQEQP